MGIRDARRGETGESIKRCVFLHSTQWGGVIVCVCVVLVSDVRRDERYYISVAAASQ